MRGFLAAFRFLTILPLPGTSLLGDEDWGQATAWYPVVGLVLGAILAGLDLGLRWLLPNGVASALLLVAWVTLTGALHLDGFVDCCDGLLVAAPPARRLEILRDVHVGAFGVVGAALLLLTKHATLAALPHALRLPALLFIPVLGRWAMTGAVLAYPYARPGPGLGRMAQTGARRRHLVVATATTLLVAAVAWWLGLGWVVLALFACIVLAAWLTAQWIQARLGGLTGDAYGALCEIGEASGLLLLVILIQQGVLP